jgi:hypothetical protein
MRAIARALVALIVLQTAGCAGRGTVPVLPSAKRVHMVSPWRYYDLWQALDAGRGILLGTRDGQHLSGMFVSGGARTIRLRTQHGPTTVAVEDIRYLVNAIDLSHARTGVIAGGILGLGTGITLSHLSSGQSGSSPAPKPAVGKAARTSDSSNSSSGESAATGESSSGSNTGTTPDASSGGSSAGSDAYETGQGASSNSSASGDPTATGSNVYGEGGSSQSSGGSSAGGGTSSEPAASGSSGGSSNNTVIFVNFHSDGRSGSSAPRTDEPPTTGAGGQSSPAVRAFFYTITFTAAGALAGWLVGRSMKRSTPRVDYILFPANLDDQASRSPEQYLADQVALPVEDMTASESLLPGSGFESARSAHQFAQFAHAGRVVSLHERVGAIITSEDARAYGLFPTVKRFERALIVRLDRIEERTGQENRYVAIVTYYDGVQPMVTLQRMTPRDVITLSTQIGLIGSGLL